jgi:MSHA biogenesis protein MshE
MRSIGPSGIVLVTGPTGSGKTTTLYAALNALNTPEKKIITVEDPVEYRLPGESTRCRYMKKSI